MSTVLAVNSFQRGVGKSMAVANLAVLIAMQGYRVGVVDTDFQSPAVHYLFGLPESYTDNCLNDVLAGKCRIQEATYDVTPHLHEDITGRIFLTPASIDAAQIVKVMNKRFDLNVLDESLDLLSEELKLDILLIDTHAGLDEQTMGLIAMSNSLIIVMRLDPQTYQGVAVTVEVARRLELPQITLIVNDLLPSYEVDQVKSQLEAAYHCPVIAVIPHANEMMSLTHSKIFVSHYPKHVVTAQFKRAANMLVAGIHS
uniref:MinD/ParA family protein n=1 Tax=Oscillatoriales cyanobacterium SpSt-402 TaxID=2282168 RepID=A0A832M210_9CYAN